MQNHRRKRAILFGHGRFARCLFPEVIQEAQSSVGLEEAPLRSAGAPLLLEHDRGAAPDGVQFRRLSTRAGRTEPLRCLTGRLTNLKACSDGRQYSSVWNLQQRRRGSLIGK